MSQWGVLSLLLLLVIAESTVLIRISPKFYDVSALVFIASITLCLASKTASLMLKAAEQGNAEQGVSRPIIDVVNMLTELSFWLLLDLFVIEMRMVQDMLQAADRKEYDARLRVSFKLKTIALPVLVGIGVLYRLIVCFKIFKFQFYDDNLELFIVL